MMAFQGNSLETMADQFLPLKFPFRGVDVSDETLRQPPDTTAEGQNVRAYDAAEDRRRGGSRSGISRFIDEQVSGENLIQFLGAVVTTTDEAMGWVFEGRDFGFTGFYGSIGFYGGIGGVGGEIGVNGGGGYQSNLSYDKPKYHLELEVSSSTMSVGDTAVITARFKDEDGDPPDWEVDERRTVELRTNPADKDGHLVQAGTNFAGVATFNVTNTLEEVIAYAGRDVTKRKNGINTVEISWETTVEYTLTPGSGGSYPVGDTAVIAITTSPPISSTYTFALISGGLESGITSDSDDIVSGVGEIRLTPNAPESGSATYEMYDEFGNPVGQFTITWG